MRQEMEHKTRILQQQLNSSIRKSTYLNAGIVTLREEKNEEAREVQKSLDESIQKRIALQKELDVSKDESRAARQQHELDVAELQTQHGAFLESMRESFDTLEQELNSSKRECTNYEHLKEQVTMTQKQRDILQSQVIQSREERDESIRETSLLRCNMNAQIEEVTTVRDELENQRARTHESEQQQRQMAAQLTVVTAERDRLRQQLDDATNEITTQQAEMMGERAALRQQIDEQANAAAEEQGRD